MGHQIDAGEHEICFTDGAWLVCGWCDPFYDPTAGMSKKARSAWLYDHQGETDIPVSAVLAADEAVPHDFSAAKDGGFLEGHFRRPIDERSFFACREFLAAAAREGLPITGSY